MNTRRTGILTALLLTAALFLSMPGMLRSVLSRDPNRMAESLRPPRLHTLTVWMLGKDCEDGKLIAKACAAFEKEHPGVRIFLRNAGSQELLLPDAVPPDVVLFETGSFNFPERALTPLADAAAPSGMFAGVSYAVPLWLSPNVLSLPSAWLTADTQSAAASLLGASPPKPSGEANTLLAPAQLPWEKLLQPGMLKLPKGVALQQLLSMCPYPKREALSRLPFEAATPQAQVRTLSQHLKASETESQLAGCVLTPAVSDRVRYGAICRDEEEARAFLRFLQQDFAKEAPALGLIPFSEVEGTYHPLIHQALTLFQGVHTLPNAFAHLKGELNALCSDAFSRCADPVETLLKLR